MKQKSNNVQCCAEPYFRKSGWPDIQIAHTLKKHLLIFFLRFYFRLRIAFKGRKDCICSLIIWYKLQVNCICPRTTVQMLSTYCLVCGSFIWLVCLGGFCVCVLLGFFVLLFFFPFLSYSSKVNWIEVEALFVYVHLYAGALVQLTLCKKKGNFLFNYLTYNIYILCVTLIPSSLWIWCLWMQWKYLTLGGIARKGCYCSDMVVYGLVTLVTTWNIATGSS